jgi:hypothetical protein
MALRGLVDLQEDSIGFFASLRLDLSMASGYIEYDAFA